ncbi:MAG: MMPL family transporter [Corynebacteriales bacterium]|nr:MMPL family transporter [Mycobacteriales bacterium]
MFKSIGRLVVGRPWLTILAWVIAAAVLVLSAPTVEPSNDQSDFLPSKYEGVRAVKVQEEAFPDNKGETALVVAIRKDGQALTEPQQAEINQLASTLDGKKIDHITAVRPDMVSPNGKVQTLAIQLDTTDVTKYEHSVEQLRDGIKDANIEGVNLRLTGNAATNYDSTKSFEESDKITFMATIVVIFVLLLVTFRGILAALMPIITVMLVLAVSNSLINIVTKAFNLTADQTSASMLPIVLFGVGTDYILFLLFRYRERLRMGEDKKEAMANSVHRVGEVIAASAGAVIIAFSALLFAQLGMLRSMGPSMAIAVATALVASLTLIPAVVSLIGPKIFWPSKAWKVQPKHGISTKIGKALSRKPAIFAAVSALILIVLGVGMFQFKPSYEMAAAPKDTDSYLGMEDMKKGFPPGAFDATQVYIRSENGEKLSDEDINQVATALDGAEGVGDVPEFNPQMSLSEDGTVAKLEVELEDNPTSSKAMDNIRDHVRPVAHEAAPEGTEVLVGGTTAIFVDLNDSMNRDYKVVFPIAGVLIAIILGLLLRSVISPIYLIIAVVLSFAATIGASSFLFQGLMNHNGLLFFMPLIVYLFVVALGTDYNILTIARLREEAQEGHAPKEATERAFVHVAPTVASAGLILAASFATFLLADADMMQEMGTSVAIGIALSAFVMSMFLVPALTKMLGHFAWWPGHGDMPSHKDGAAASKDAELAEATRK